jgi:hypothetical protein
MKVKLARAEKIEVGVVLFRDDFYRLIMGQNRDRNQLEAAALQAARLNECWKAEPKDGWGVESDDEGNCTTLATEPYEAPAGWRWVAVMGVMHLPDGLQPFMYEHGPEQANFNMVSRRAMENIFHEFVRRVEIKAQGPWHSRN